MLCYPRQVVLVNGVLTSLPRGQFVTVGDVYLSYGAGQVQVWMSGGLWAAASVRRTRNVPSGYYIDEKFQVRSPLVADENPTPAHGHQMPTARA